MKKMFAKLGIPSMLSMVFVLGGLLFGVGRATAQSTTVSPQGAGPIKTTGTWKTETDAKAALLIEIDNLNQMLNNNPNNFNQLKMKLTIYREIVLSLEGGMSVPEAALFNYNKWKPGLHSDAQPVPTMPASDWLVIYTDMLNVLQV